MDAGGEEAKQERHGAAGPQALPPLPSRRRRRPHHGMATLFESLVAAGVLEPDNALLAEMPTRIGEEVRKLDEKIADAEENLGEIEVREAHLAKSLYFIRVREKVL